MFHLFIRTDASAAVRLHGRNEDRKMNDQTSERSALWIDFAFVASCLGLVAGILAVIGQV